MSDVFSSPALEALNDRVAALEAGGGAPAATGFRFQQSNFALGDDVTLTWDMSAGTFYGDGVEDVMAWNAGDTALEITAPGLVLATLSVRFAAPTADGYVSVFLLSGIDDLGASAERPTENGQPARWLNVNSHGVLSASGGYAEAPAQVQVQLNQVGQATNVSSALLRLTHVQGLYF